MQDEFKITAIPLKRILKIAVYLPNDYYKNDNNYPLVIALDGQFLFKFFDEDNRKIDLSTYLKESDRRFIVISLFSPRLDIPEWRISELNPYYMGNNDKIDSSYAYNFSNYLVNELIPLLKTKYRFNDDIYLFGINEACISSIYMLYAFNIFMGAILFSPKINDCNHKFLEDIDMRFDKNKKLYLYMGGKNINDNEENQFYDLSAYITKRNPDYFILDYNQDKDNEIETISEYINKGLDIIK